MSQQVFSGAEEEFRYQRYQRIFLCKHVFNPIPPPFNMPIHVFAMLRLCSGLLSRVCSGLLPRSEQATSRGLEIATPEPSLSLRRSSVSQHAWYGTDADGGLDQAPLPAEAKRLQKRFSDGEAAKRRCAAPSSRVEAPPFLQPAHISLAALSAQARRPAHRDPRRGAERHRGAAPPAGGAARGLATSSHLSAREG